MEKTYTYENATVKIIFSNKPSSENIRKATEHFLRKVIEERKTYGNRN